MKNITLYMALLAGLTLSSVLVQAREDVRSGKRSARASFKTEAGDCVSPQAQFDMQINNVRARLLTGGDAWWNLSEARYEVPKSDGTGASLNALFAGAIWISGKDAGENLKCAAQRYRQGGDDYWPGPLVNGVIDKANCNKYDRFFNVFGSDIAKAQAAFLQKGSLTTIADIPKGLLSWPAKGNPHLASDPSLVGETFNIDENLAPFFDYDNSLDYDPVKGDYPIIPCRGKESEAFADQMVFSVFNDVGNIHSESNGQSIGVQVNSLAFAFQTTDDINNMTFYKYEIINKSANALYETYISQWADPDLGCFENDRVGCDTSRSLGIIYNDGNDNDCNGVAGYGSQLPLLGIDFFEGPLGDDSLHTQLGLTSFVYFINVGTGDPKSDPSSAAQYRNFQTGFWKDGTPFTEGGTGYSTAGGTETNFCFPGNPSDLSSWSDYTSGQPPGDRRFVQTSGPFTLNPGNPQYVTVGCVFVRPPGGVGSPPNFATTIAPADDKAQLLFDGCFKLVDGPQAPTLAIRELSNEIIINLQNLVGSNNYGEIFDDPFPAAIQYIKDHLGGVGDSTYTFEGYKLYQVTDSKVSATDLDDPTKARLYAQVDVKNGVSKLINYERDAVLGLFIPVLKVDGNNAGISTSFRITQDLFASGANKNLVNHKTYFYTAIAYAHNDYETYTQADPNGDAQLLPYLQGRGNFRVYSAIPHIPDPRNEGTVVTSQWGEAVEVKRIEGQGNGGSSLQLDSATIEQIIASGEYAFADTLTYVKGFDPIGFKITDPVSLKEADFELQFVDADTNPVGATTSWLLHDITNDDTIFSERNLDRPYEQLIALNKNGERYDYGFSVKFGTPAKVYTVPANHPINGLPQRYVYSPLPSSIEYQNPLEPWLSFVRDEGNNEPSNWIRSGTFANDPGGPGGTSQYAEVYDDNWYYIGSGAPPAYPNFTYTDSLEIFEKIINGTWAPYCLAANYASKSPADGAPAYVYGPGFKWRNYAQTVPPQNNLDKLASVDIVITPDKSKWTRCVVFETGEDEGINEGNTFYVRPSSPAILVNKGALKGQIRMHHSWDKDNNWYMDGSHGETPDTGRSWFPGYAVNVETGERLNIAFGESSDQGDQNGRDMKWNPTANIFAPVGDFPYFGGKHFIYVMASKYNEGDTAQRLLLDNYANLVSNLQNINANVRPVYLDLMWTSIPYLSRGYSFVDGYIPPAEVKIKLRVEQPYKRLTTSATPSGEDGLPRYRFSTKGMGPLEKSEEVAKSACDMMRAVPNPYLAYSAYETDQNSNKIKITNLPNNCNITIYALDGTIIRKLSRAIGVDPANNKKIDISDGASGNDINLDNTVDWDLKNDKGIPVSGGMYLIHIDAPGLCEKTIKWFGAIRPADTSNF